MLSFTLLVLLSQTCPGYGTGVDGDLNVTSGRVIPNESFALAQSVAAGEAVVTLEAGAVLAKRLPGALVMLHQTQAMTASGVGATSPFNVSSLGVGGYELARVLSVSGASVTLQMPLQQGFAAPGAQLVFVPQYNKVTVSGAATLAASPWNGSSGGLLVLVATGAVQLDGVLDARAAGFRGGAENYGLFDDATMTCAPGAFSGESFALGAPTRSRLGVWTAGGGSVCSDNGGGGGANVGAGGTGGLAFFTPDYTPGATRGGAAALRTNAQLLFGGGGGGAYGDLTSQVATPGGAGGGIVFVRAVSMTGTGRIIVDGETALSSPSNGSGGGGAAGTIALELSSTLSCGLLTARGGGGGSSAPSHGVGGGGAGGRIQVRASALLTCPRDVFAGLAGDWPDGGRNFGFPTSATDPKSVGETGVDLGDGGCVPFLVDPVLTIHRPAEGELWVGSPFCFDGAANGATVSGSVDGQPLAAVAVLPTQQWRLCVTGDLPTGAHTLVVQMFDGNGAPMAEARAAFRSRSQPLGVGCGCDGAAGGDLGVLALALTLIGRRRTSATPSGANTARKREAGGIPARSRHCDRAASQKREARAASSSPLRCSLHERGKVEAARGPGSQETCPSEQSLCLLFPSERAEGPMRRLLLSLALVCGAPAFAQDVAVPLPPVDVPVPDAQAAPSSVTRSSPSGLVTLIDTAAHKGEAKDTAELLAPTPGAVLSDAGGVGQRKSLSLRGAGSTGVMVLLDGIPLTSPGTAVDLSRIPAVITERLEVLRGAASARYGPGALGGVVNLVTRRPTHGVSLTAEATWGNFGTALASASASGALWGGDGLVVVHGARSSGDFAFLYDEQPSYEGNPLTPLARNNNQASGAGALLRYRTELSPKWSLDVLGEGGADTRRLAGTVQNPTTDSSEDAAHGLLGARLTRRFEGGGEISALGWGRLEDSTLMGSPFGAGPWKQDQGAAGLDVAYSQLVFSRHGLSAAASLSTDWLRGPKGSSAAWARAGAMLGDEVFFFDGLFSVNASVRVDQSGPFTGISPRAGALVLLPKGFELRVNGGQAHRPPTFLELYVLQGHLAPNPNLRPERALFVDASVAFRHERAFVQVGGFGALYEDLITYEYYPPQLARPYNFQAARVMGLEVEGTFEPTGWLSMAASYTLLSTQNLKDDPRYYGKRLPYRPTHKLHARASVGPHWLRARTEVLWQSEQFTNRTETVALASRAFVNFGIIVQPVSTPTTTVALALEMKNVLDVASQDLDGYPLPSRGAYLTLSVAWDDSQSPLPVIASLDASP